jgi:hypothetical protein
VKRVFQFGFVPSLAGIKTIHEITRNRTNKVRSPSCEFVDRFILKVNRDGGHDLAQLRFVPAANQVQLKVPLPLSAQLLLQQSESAVQAAETGKQVAAAAAVGAMIVVTKGIVTAAAIPRCFTSDRRDVCCVFDCGGHGSCKRLEFLNCVSAYHTTSSTTGVFISTDSNRAISATVVWPSQLAQINAAAGLRQ